MKSGVSNQKFSMKVVSITLSLVAINLLILIISSCVGDDPTFGNPFGDCPAASNANAVDLSVFYSPFRNSMYSSPTDTVSLDEFAFNFELTPELISSSEKGGFPGQTYALSCAQAFNFKNISNIAVILKSPFNNLPIGTDISYLLILPDKTTLDDLRDFQRTASFFTMKFTVVPSNFSQLHTQTFLFLRDGSQIVVESTSPYIQTN